MNILQFCAIIIGYNKRKETHMVKLIVSDVDGTLLTNGQSAPSQKVITSITSAIQKGIKFAIASGRSYEDLAELFAPVKNDVYFIAHDGALTVKNGARLFHQPLQMEIVRSLVQAYGTDMGCIAFYSKDNCYCIGKPNEFVKSLNIVPIKGLYEIKDLIYKVGIYGRASIKALQITGARLCALSDGCIEYVSSVAQKGTALSDLQMRLFMNKFDTAAIGNYLNDVKMLKNAKYSAAMASSPNEAKDASAYVVEDACEFIQKCIDT